MRTFGYGRGVIKLFVRRVMKLLVLDVVKSACAKRTSAAAGERLHMAIEMQSHTESCACCELIPASA